MRRAPLRSEPPTAPFRTSARLALIRRHLKANIRQRFSAPDAARLVGLHPTYFSTFFRKRVGISFVRWVRLVRLHHALVLAVRTDLPPARIASLSGFGSLRSLQRAMNQLESSTLTNYRTKYREQREG